MTAESWLSPVMEGTCWLIWCCKCQLQDRSPASENISQNQGGEANCRGLALEVKRAMKESRPEYLLLSSLGKSRELLLITDVQCMISLSLLLFTLFSLGWHYHVYLKGNACFS